ncbi:uncharacterized protein TNCV_5057241 [Trichonephila clavipes]|nr:uncharacterized protein TNCV_5057241 [Trichonephila clavipes]
MVPINRKSVTVPLNQNRLIHAQINHFPLKPTILDNSQSQGGTFDEIVYKNSKAHSQPLVYAALSRFTTQEGLHFVLIDECPRQTKQRNDASITK